jgi:MFS family permease
MISPLRAAGLMAERARAQLSTDAAPRRAWVIWGVGAAFYSYGFLQRVAPSVMISDLLDAFNVTAAAIGGLSATYFYAYAGLQIPIGVLLDRWGTRRMFLLAAACCVIGGLMFGLAPTILVAHVGRALLGAGSGVAWVGCLKVATLLFPPHRFALLSGIALALGMLGAVLGQAPLAGVIGVVGWREAASGAALLAIAFGAALWRLLPREIAGGGDEDTPHTAQPAPVWAGIRRVLSTPQTWLVACYGSLMTVPMLGFATLWGVPYLMTRFDVSRPVAGAGTSLLLVGWAIGAPLYGWWSDRSGRRRTPMIVGASLNLATILAALYLPGLAFPVVCLLLLLNGVGAGSMPLCFALARSHHPAHLAGSAYGLANTLVIGLGAVVQPIIGAVMDLTWGGAMADGSRVYGLESYQISLLVVPGAVAVALVVALLLDEPASIHAPMQVGTP